MKPNTNHLKRRKKMMQYIDPTQGNFGSFGLPETPFANSYIDNYGQNWGQPGQTNAMNPLFDGSFSIPDITPIGNSMAMTTPVTFTNPTMPSGSLGGSDLLQGRLGAAQNIANNGYQGMDLARQGFGSLKQGWGDLSLNQKFNTGIGAAQSLFGMYSGFKQLGMAKKQMEQQRNQWNQTWDATTKGLNEASELRAKLRNNGVKSGVDRDVKKYKV